MKIEKNIVPDETQQPVSIVDYENEMRRRNSNGNQVVSQLNDSKDDDGEETNLSPYDAEQYNNIANGRSNYEQYKGVVKDEDAEDNENDNSEKLNGDLDNQYSLSLNNYISSLADMAEKPLSPEERQKKERTKGIVAGIGALGNIANAFSNLIYTGKGAPSQTLPQTPDYNAAIDRLRAEERTKVKNYLANSAQKLAALKAERDYNDSQNYKNATLYMQQQKNQGDLAKIAAQIRLYEAQGNKAAADTLRAQYEALIKGNEAKYSDELYKSKAQNERARGGLISAQTKAAKASAANSWASAEKNRDARVKTILKTDGTTVEIPVSAWNASNLGKILSAVHEPLVEKTTTTDAITGMPKVIYRKRDVNSMARRIGYVLSNGTDDQVAMIEQMIGELSGEKPKKNTSSDSNTMPSLASQN